MLLKTRTALPSKQPKANQGKIFSFLLCLVSISLWVSYDSLSVRRSLAYLTPIDGDAPRGDASWRAAAGMFTASFLSPNVSVFVNATGQAAPETKTVDEEPMLFDEKDGDDEAVNTRKWIESENKISNIDLVKEYSEDTTTIDRWFDTNLIDNYPDVSATTLCHKDGWFRKANPQWNASDARQIDEWSARLMFLAIHSYHHAPARAEHEARRKGKAAPTGVGSYDYECKDAKFLVTRVNSVGMGASFRLGVITTILSAIGAGRIPVFLHNLKRYGVNATDQNEGYELLEYASSLFSCDRRDTQCVMMPTTPCVLTVDEVLNATYLKGGDSRSIRREGVVPENLKSDRVIIMDGGQMPVDYASSDALRKKINLKLATEARTIVNAWRAKNPDQPEKLKVLKSAVNTILEGNEEQHKNTKQFPRFKDIALMYFMRPNPNTQRQVEEGLKAVIPDSLDSDMTLGLPIRGSDKCEHESTCLPFNKYMKLSEETWMEEFSMRGKMGNLIITTEDPKLFAQRHQHTNSSQLIPGNPFPWNLVVNEADVMQGTGSTRAFKESGDDIMVSSFIALKMQLHATKMYGNCCSNFHNLMFDFARQGCGMTLKTTCMQQLEGTEYKMCCAWTKTEECQAIRANMTKTNSRSNRRRRRRRKS